MLSYICGLRGQLNLWMRENAINKLGSYMYKISFNALGVKLLQFTPSSVV